MLNRKKILLPLIIILLIVLSGCGSKATTDMAVNEIVADGYSGSLEREVLADQADIDRKLIEYWDFNIEVQNTNNAVSEIVNKTQSLKGYVVESSINNNTNTINAHLTVKIPRENIQEMTDYLQNIGRVNNSSNRTEDVTMEYYDTEARLQVLKKQEERLLSFMEGKTNNIQDLLAVEQELSRVRAERESLQARMNYLNNATTYSQISIYLRQQSGSEITAPQGTWGQAVQSFISSINSLINLGNALIIVFFKAIPYLIVIGIVYFIVDYFRNRRKK